MRSEDHAGVMGSCSCSHSCCLWQINWCPGYTAVVIAAAAYELPRLLLLLLLLLLLPLLHLLLLLLLLSCPTCLTHLIAEEGHLREVESNTRQRALAVQQDRPPKRQLLP
jgi:hypothetical protein